MKKEFSKFWVRSTQPRKQRKYRYNAPMHIRQKLVSAHLDKKLRDEYKKRSISLRKGDEVMVMRGEFRKKTGTVARIDLKRLKIFVDGIKKKKVSGQEVDAALEPSNVKIIKLNLDDKMRKKILLRKEAKKEVKK
ncbi:MAG: 50S ribosomal protein L24 [Candidatus Aenigmatarchaeota archaeon]